MGRGLIGSIVYIEITRKRLGKRGVRSAEYGVRSVENAKSGKCRVWKTRSVENAECRKYIKEKDIKKYIHA